MSSPHTSPSDAHQLARFNMIEQQIRPWEVLDRRVLDLLTEVRREDFVPRALRNLAFADMELPLNQPPVEGQVMLAPRVEARLLQDLAIQSTDRVLEIGTGSGHMAALLASLAREVVSLEIDEGLAVAARERLRLAGIDNAAVRVADAAADGFAACRTEAPWDVILLSGSVSEVPASLLDLLTPGGRLGAIVGDEPVMRATLITRTADQTFETVQPWDTVAPRLRNFPQRSRFSF
jgi:protein-L-isoaspartate(D-aspartate) O-methyltransferase